MGFIANPYAITLIYSSQVAVLNSEAGHFRLTIALWARRPNLYGIGISGPRRGLFDWNIRMK